MKPLSLACLALVCAVTAMGEPSPQPERVVVDSQAKGAPFPHFWEQMFGSGRAILSLRESYRDDVTMVKAITGFEYLRFHDILDDDVGLVVTKPDGTLGYNFSEVDEIFDGLLDRGVRPFVELSFMPRALAANPRQHAFWYRPIPSPPKDYNQWATVIHAFTEHLVERYGLSEVNHWYFEVWNEPNLDFWTGDPKQQTYFKLYDAAARAIKAVSPTLRVGGPATAQAAWIPEFIEHCAKDRVPVDFVSTHVYGNDPPSVIGASQPVPVRDMVGLAVRKVFREVGRSAMPHLPIIFSEFNASWSTNTSVTDSAFMGPWMANTIRECDGFVSMMSYWDFSDVFDEQGVTIKPFYGGYGLIAEGHIPKAAFNAFALFHQLGTERIPAAAPWILATRRADGSLALVVWHYTDPDVTEPPRQYDIKVSGWGDASKALIQYVDADHGSALGAWNRMGSPSYPSRGQEKELQEDAKLPPAKSISIDQGRIRVMLPAHGLALIELPARSSH